MQYAQISLHIGRPIRYYFKYNKAQFVHKCKLLAQYFGLLDMVHNYEISIIAFEHYPYYNCRHVVRSSIFIVESKESLGKMNQSDELSGHVMK